MADDFRIRLNHAELEKILKEAVMAELRAVADRVVAAMDHPDDYDIEEFVGQNRARVSVKTNSVEAHVDEAREHNLVRALGSVQGG